MEQAVSTGSLLQVLEVFGMQSIRAYHDEGVLLALHKPEDHDIIIESMRQKSEAKLIKELQSHFDEHFEKGATCNDYDIIAESFELTKDDKGKITVVKRKTACQVLN